MTIDDARYGVPALIVALLLAVGCAGADEQPELMTNAGLRQLTRDQWNSTQTFIKDCMDERGFEWTVQEFDSEALNMPTGNDPEARILDITLTAEDAQRDGFGVVDGVSDPVGLEPVVDPNAEYRDGLTAAAFSAYLAALDAEGGCREKADSATEDEFADVIVRFTESVDQLQSVVFDSSEFAEIANGWSGCMAQRGWNDASLLDFDQQIRSEVAAGLESATVVSAAGEEEDAPVRQVPTQDLQRLREFEVGAAVGYVECFDPYRTAYTELVDAAYSGL